MESASKNSRVRQRTGRKRPCLWMLGVLALALSISGTAFAGGNTGFPDPSDPTQMILQLWDPARFPITWVLSDDGIPGSGIDNATLESELTTAFDAWEGIATSQAAFTAGGQVPIREVGLGGPFSPNVDGRFVVTFTDPEVIFPPGVLALAFTFSFTDETVVTAGNSDLDGDGMPDIAEGTYPAGTIFDADIAFNSSVAWSVSGTNGSYDVQAVALHEVGHTLGLSHSSIRESVMFPFLGNDIAAARLLEQDDISYVSSFYPAEPAYSTALGSIQGNVSHGLTGAPVLGAHVYAVDPADGSARAGAFSGTTGDYEIPGLPAGDYLVAIEPLDGDPPGLDPHRINEVVALTLDTIFPEEFYDDDEGAIEPSASAAATISVSAGASSAGVDIVTNTLELPATGISLFAGYNLMSYPVEVPTDLGAFDLLESLGGEGLATAIDRYDAGSGHFERAHYHAGAASGSDFPILRGEGYVVHTSSGPNAFAFTGATDCPKLDLAVGTNLIGVPCPNPGYSAFELLQDLGSDIEVTRVTRHNGSTASYEIAEYDGGGNPTGVDFAVVNGEGYVVEMRAPKLGLELPAASRSVAPILTGLSPGHGVPGSTVLIVGEGFDSNAAGNTVTFNGMGAAVIVATNTSLTAVVPPNAVSGPVVVSVGGLASNSLDFVVESSAIPENPTGETELVSGQTALGSLSTNGEQDRYTFTAMAGSFVTLSAESIIPGSPDLALALEDPLGIIVATDDNSGAGTNPTITQYELQRAGTFTAVVTNVPGSGVGDYTLKLTVTPVPAAPRISITGGNYQSGVAGSQLAEPLEVFVNSVTGAPLAGYPITFTATGEVIAALGGGPINAGTVLLNTNKSGIVRVQTTLGATPGSYNISVSAPNLAPAQFEVAATDVAVATVNISGDLQSGTVGQTLAQPLEVELLDAQSNPVEGALVAFEVVSGGGSVSPSGGQNTGADGKASAQFTLGTDASKAQLVAAFVPNSSQPVVFEATPNPGSPARMESNRSNFSRMTLGTAVLNAIYIQVFDQYDNPIPNVTIDFTTSDSELEKTIGLDVDGTIFDTDQTNEDGRLVAGLIAQVPIIPTIDEFGTKNDPNLASGLYTVTAQATGGSNPQVVFNVDVDMGPTLTTLYIQNAHALLGQDLPQPVDKAIRVYKRVDVYLDEDEDDEDDDNGEFHDEDFTSKVGYGVQSVSIDIRFERADGKDEAAEGLNPTQSDTTSRSTDSSGTASFPVTMGQAWGTTVMVATTDQIDISWLGRDGTTDLYPPQSFTDPNDFADATILRATPVIISVDLDDPPPAAPDVPSGIALDGVRLLLNGNAFFDAADYFVSPPPDLQDFPDTLEVWVGGVKQESLTAEMMLDSAFSDIEIKYYPTAVQLITSDGSEATKNAVEWDLVKDRAGNEGNTPPVGVPPQKDGVLFIYP